VTFGADDDVDVRWIIDREHAPSAMTPLAEPAIRLGRPGAVRAYEECGFELLSTLGREPPHANGYDYIVDEPLPRAEAEAFATGLRALSDQHGGPGAVWQTRILPMVRAGCAWFETAPPDTPYRELAEQRAYVWSLTGIAGVLARHDLEAVARLCATVVG